MKRLRTFLLLFVVIAPFLMGNAPSPYPYPDYYEEFMATPVTVEEDESHYLYKTTITNTGEGYIDFNYSYLRFTTDDVYIRDSHPRKDIILPGATKEVTFVSATEYAPTDYELLLLAYVDNVHKTTFSNVRDFARREDELFHREYWGEYYEYSFNVDYERDEDYTSELIVTYKYNDEVYTQYMRPSGTNSVYFEATEKIDAEEIEFLDFNNVLGRKRGSGYGGLVWGIFLITALLFSAAVAAVIALPIGITILTIYLVKKNRARKEEAEHESQDKRRD